ncbi:hypothetical protein GCM10022254_41620 [Actinomadura meridiana]|uniref:Virulence plasmid A protein n=1 Tax=Actinomadura meridiana TaxID=559626 RepID=A0ABP8C7Q8_9ACTN
MSESDPSPTATVRHTVTGTVTFADGTPASGVTVITSARRLRSRSPLGEAVTGPDGRYRIVYPAAAVAATDAGTAPAELVVSTAPDGPHGTIEAVRLSPVRDEIVDLTVPADGISEFDRLLAAVSPLLEGVSLDELRGTESDRDEIGFLAGACGRPAAQVGHLALAGRHTTATGLPAELFYGLFRQGLPAHLSTLASRPTADIRAALTAAATAGVISPVEADTATDFAARLRASEVKAFVQGTDGTPTSPIARIFAAAVPDTTVREHVYNAYLDHDGNLARFWAVLKRDEQAAPHVDRLQLALQLAAMTGNNSALVEALLLRFDRGDLTHPRDLAALTDAAWTELIESTGGVPLEATELLTTQTATNKRTPNNPPPTTDGAPPTTEGAPPTTDSAPSATDDPPPATDSAMAMTDGASSATDVGGAYRELVVGLVAEAYPTAHVRHRLAASNASAPAARFLSANPEFDLLITPINAATVPDEPARAELAGIQRLMKLTPAFDTVQTLRARGFDSAHGIARTGRDAFAAQVADALPSDEAAAVHARATQVHATAANLVADLRTANQFDVPWLAAPPEQEAMLVQVPDWEDLFGPTDYCACSECRSVYGQPAYLADLLLFLRSVGLYGDPPPEGSEGSVADGLYRRRPDLWDVELSCDNTNLPLPYVDLVNELLETVIVERSTLPGAKLRQTSGDPGQLRVQPQHVNPAAYEVVRRAVYPWSLPFDLWADQTRDSLAHLGVRWDRLMAVLHPSGAGGVAVAVEELGLPSTAGRIITGEPLSPGRTLAEFYGRPADTPPGGLVNDLAQVRHMLDTADLRYAELVEVLDTRFVNPGGTIQITSTDPKYPCDTNLMVLQGLDFYALDRLHRFVRLQRALAAPAPGLSTIELDRVLMAANNQGRLDGTGLRSVLAARRLAARLDLPVDEVLAFYGPLPTYRYATAAEPPLYDRLFLDPSVVILPPGQASPFELNAARTELRIVGSLVDPAVTAALLGVLEVTDTELAALVTGRRSATPNRLLNLANLSALFRTVRLARALGLPIEDLLRLIELYGGGGPFPVPPEDWYGGEPELMSGIPMRLPTVPLVPPPVGGADPELASGAPMRPPSHPDGPTVGVATVDKSIEATERFLDAVADIVDRGFTVAELDAVLTATLPAHDGPLPDDTALAATLTALRAALQAVYQQTAQTSDEKGELTRKDLALLGWDAALVQEAVTTLLGTVVYAAPLDALPSGITLPPSMRFEAPTEGEPGPGRLLCTGPMTASQRAALTGASTATPAFVTAVNALHQAPRTFVTTKMKALRIPIYSAPLAVLPIDLKLPTGLAGRVFYDVGEHALRSRAYLSAEELAALGAASADAAFREAVDALGLAQRAAPAPDNVFLTADDAAALFDPDGQSPARRFAYVLAKLNPYLRRVLSEITVKQQLGTAAGLDAASADVLLGTWLRSPSKPLALQDFLTPRYVGSDPAVVITRDGFLEQFSTLSLLHRVSTVLARLRIRADEIPWVFEYAASGGWLDLNTLPVTATPGASPLFPRFVRLLRLARLRDGIPGRGRTLRAVFAAARVPGATVPDVLTELAAQTSWDRADLDALCAPGLVGVSTAAGFHGEERLLELLDAVRLLDRLGVSAERAAGWLPPDVTSQAAQAAWQAAKARHTLAEWPEIGGTLRDRLRDRQRAALVAHLIANPLRSDSGPYWHDANTMYDYFLLDVEMGACQQTTRIAQAIFSVQLFVQRVRLNLESLYADDDADVWKQWEWLKSYRLWEANQKVFLYPENYFQPELRATKSPLFEALEDELMQKEMTADNVEDALRHYLEQLDKVSRLRPIGAFTDDTTSPPTVHIVAHTVAKPREHYFRSWVNKNEWTPWRRVELDIDSDTIFPVVWNRRLYLFWPTFTMATDQPQIRMPQGTEPMPDPPKFWKMRFNWSRYVNGRWEPKKSTKIFLRIEQGAYNPDWIDVDYSNIFTRIGTRFRDFQFRPKIDPVSKDLVIWCVDDFLRRNDDGTYTTKSGFFRFSAGLDEVIIDPITERTAAYEASVPFIHYSDYSLDENHERVEYVSPEVEESGKVFIADPTKRRYDSETSVLALNATPGDQLYRVLNLTQHPMDWDRFVAFFSDGRRGYLIDPHLVYLPTLRERPSSAPGRDRRALRSGRELAALAATRADRTRTGLVLPQDLPRSGGRMGSSELGAGRVLADLAAVPKLTFRRLYHPHVHSFGAELNRWGVTGLYNRRLQTQPEIYTGPFDFNDYYKPYVVTVPEVPGEPVEFGFDDAYADYNWELFFHAPLMVAQRLSANQDFEQAQRWFHFIFDPTNRDYDGDPPQRYWITKPFFQASSDTYAQQRIEAILRKLAEGDPDTQKAVDRWLANPFQPDVVARLRTTAYQKAVVMKYLDNLIAWGDHLFRQDTLESINQATQLYILADELLGRRPEEITGRAEPAPRSFRQLLSSRPADAVVAAVENLVPAPAHDVQPSIRPGVNLAWLDYFRVPRNDKLVGYWDTVEDRLFKIRHCQNIEGVRRQVPLFGAPIDPNLLVRAAAAGVDLATALDDISAPLPHYRFEPMLAKAREYAATVTAFGNALLAALEKRDGEALARLRSGHELALLDAAREVRHQQVKEADEAVAALDRSRELARDKRRYYADRLDEPMNAYEKAQTRLHEDALDQQDLAALVDMAAAIVGFLPDSKIGSPPTVGGTFGGSNIVSMLRGLSSAFGSYATRSNSQGSQQLTLSSYARRAEEWTFQQGQATIETTQFDKQILGAQIRQAIAAKELENHDLQREHAHEIDRFMREKFTSTELYDWLAGQLSTSYFQAYQLAYDVAKRAERSFRHELGVADSSFVNFGYWDSLHKGLLAGERLSADLNRMDAAYLEANSREFELSKRVSLAQLDPTALLRLKETGTCFVSLPEAFFDLDTPGHYLRRIKNLAITVPCVAGPYTSVNLTARLLHSSVRVDPVVANGKKYARGTADPRFRDYTGPVQSIVTSTGQDDSGLFETNLRDERFLPFEGAGAISEWQLSLPDTFRQFDYESITDVVLHLRYTARDGGDELADHAVAELHDALNTWLHSGEKSLYRVFSARREFSDQWSRFLAPTGAADPTAIFTIAKGRFPRVFHGEKLTIAKPSVVLVLSQELTPDGSGRYLDAYPEGLREQLTAKVTTPTHQSATVKLTVDAALSGQPRGALTVAGGQVHEPDQAWTVSLSREEVGQLPPVLVRDGLLNPDAVLDLLLIWQYTVRPA